jgi:hypothetical protein
MDSSYYDTHSLRYQVALRLGLNDVPDVLWGRNIVRQHVIWWNGAASSAEKSEVQDRLLDLVQEDVSAVKQLGGDITAWTTQQKRERSSVEADLSPDDSIALRAEALCVFWAKLAEAGRDVRSFRKKVLGRTAISADEANRLLTSPAAALMRAEAFHRHGAPIVGHSAELDIEERSNPFERPFRIRGSLRIAWSTGEAVLSVKNEGPRPPESMEVWNGTEPILIAPWPQSVLGQLRKVTSKLTERYPWDTPATAWFVLTGEPPWVPPLTATSSGPDLAKNHGTITIRAAHWVPEEAVRRLYLRMKVGMNPTPTASPRRLALFRFVTERSSGINEFDHNEGERVTGLNIPPWRHLQSKWNQQYPPSHKWHYSDVRNFRRDFTEASKLLVGY